MSNPTISTLILDDNVFMGHCPQPNEENLLVFKTIVEEKEENIVMKDYDKAKILYWGAPDVYFSPEQKYSWSLLQSNIIKPATFSCLAHDVHSGIPKNMLLYYHYDEINTDYFAEGTIQLSIRKPTKEHIKRFLKEGSFNEQTR